MYIYTYFKIFRLPCNKYLYTMLIEKRFELF